MQPPRVAVILPPRETFSPAAAGAVGLLAHRLALAPGGFSPTVFGRPGAAPFRDVPFVPVRPAWLPAGQARRYAAGVARELRRNPPALIEVHNRPLVALDLARRFPTVPVSLFLHNDPQGMRRARTPEERAALLSALAKVVAVSVFLRRRFLADLAAPGDVVVARNCIDLAEIPRCAERDSTIVLVGRVTADKGADTFVRACARALPALPGWRAELLGADRFGADSPDTPFLRALRPEAAAAGVAMTGWRPHADVLATMARAAMVVVPSRVAEGFGLTALEAMACGAALLCSARGALPEVAGEVAVLIDPEDAQALAAAIVDLARDPARRAALGEAGRARARRFDVSAAAATLEALRRDTLAAWPRRFGRPI
jgi:glycosyltransferase involved in cell wall biosynthesis